jgi:hypothetical protein
VVVVVVGSQRVDYLSGTHAGRAADKGIADGEGIAYPPGTVLYKDGGFQGYEPAGAKTRQAKKKAGGWGANGGGEARQSEAGAHPGGRGACAGRREALSDSEGCLAEHGRGYFRFSQGGRLWVAQCSG